MNRYLRRHKTRRRSADDNVGERPVGIGDETEAYETTECADEEDYTIAGDVWRVFHSDSVPQALPSAPLGAGVLFRASMSSKIIGIAVVIVVLIAAGYFVQGRFGAVHTAYQAPVQESPGHGVVGKQKTDTDSYDVQIVYTNDGYATTSLTIRKGTRVRFLNESSMGEWPASGIHPTHTLYPEKQPTDCLGSSFDSCASLATGEFFDYTFNYVGKWPFHDHLHGYNTGTIVVEEK